MSSSPGRTYLRVKRPRHVAPVSSLRVEGLGPSNKRARPVDNLAHLLHQSTYIAQQQQPQEPAAASTFAVWKRVDSDNSNHNKRRYVDAVLEQPQSKRRRLALTLVSASDDTATESQQQAAPKKNVILDPASRLVQDSLQSVFSGEKSVSQHLDFLSSDGRLSHETRRFLQWQGDSGNILHAAALRNDVEGTSAVLAWEIPSLLSTVDEHGSTPYQVAVAVGHVQVAQVLKAYNKSTDDDDYEYDVFMLDKTLHVNNTSKTTTTTSENDEQDEPMSVELRGGIGYWNENGELVLEAMPEDDEEQSEKGDDDDDSNDEDYVGNDYPEEDEWDSDEEEENFRDFPMFSDHGLSNDYAASDEDDAYDPQYGLYGSNGAAQQYAYDPELDRDSD